MKKIIYVLIAFSMFCCKSNNVEERTEASDLTKTNISIEDCYDSLQVTTNKEDLIALSKRFKVSNSNETNKWISKYYAAYCLIQASFIEEDLDKKDELLKKAQVFLDEALKVAPDESELYVLQILLYASAIQVDPGIRARVLGQKFAELINKAKQLNENNPRIYLLEAGGIMHRPVEYGGGPANALPILKIAQKKFDSFKTDIKYYPSWGEDEVKEYIELCQK